MKEKKNKSGNSKKEKKKRVDICLHVTDSLFCAPETNKIL